MEGEGDFREIWKLVAILSMIGIILIPFVVVMLIASVNTFPEVMTDVEATLIFITCPVTMLVLIAVNLLASVKVRRKRYAVPSMVIFMILFIIVLGKGMGNGICLIYPMISIILLFLAMPLLFSGKRRDKSPPDAAANSGNNKITEDR